MCRLVSYNHKDVCVTLTSNFRFGGTPLVTSHFKRPEMTFKASEYLLIMNVDYFVPISFNLLYYTRVTLLP